jgi:hypothetical protein
MGKKGVSKKHPMETGWIQIGRHHHSVCQTDVRVQLVEYGIEVLNATALFGRFGLMGQPLCMLGFQIVERVPEQVFGGCDKLRIILAKAKS